MASNDHPENSAKIASIAFANLGNCAPEILFEDNHLLCIYKPAGLLSQSDDSGAPDALSACRQYVGLRYKKPGDVYLGLVHRLDRSTAGPMVLARTSKAAARLSEQFRTRDTAKLYHALVAGTPAPKKGELRDWMRKDPKTRTARAATPKDRDAQEARLLYRVLEQGMCSKRMLNRLLFWQTGDETYQEDPRTKQHPFCLVEVELQTGRFHQIRFQMAKLGHPILGDIKYRSDFKLREHGLALECVSLEFEHPVQHTKMSFPGRRFLADAMQRLKQSTGQ